MKTKLFLSVFIFMNLSASFAQDVSGTRTIQDILMSYRWTPVDMYEEEDDESCFLTYTRTHEIDSTIDEGELKVYVTPYYLSDTLDPVFDEKKVGKSTTGKYLIENVGDINKIVTVTYEIVELSEKKMVQKNLISWTDAYTKTITYLASPK